MAMERPLSPFMFPTWYRFQITSVLSILHRLTGIALAVGSILLAWWLVAVAAGGEVFAATHAFIAQQRPALGLGCRVRVRDPGRLSQRIRRARRDGRADSAHLALRMLT